MVTPLLTTKLYIPPVRPELVPRPRLIERLNAGLHRKWYTRQRDRFAQSAAPHPSPTGTGGGEESGARAFVQTPPLGYNQGEAPPTAVPTESPVRENRAPGYFDKLSTGLCGGCWATGSLTAMERYLAFADMVSKGSM
ncbi:MAG: hypothetical protein H8D74_02205 [Chloroflexi bacterium]|nr:hypothetical protein [Chloroflexota bacterium]